ncbi:winged helix-turn-helix domain-containing protein [Streptomyces smyrnaeus]|uniref:winged helix-turn-helix domain-containing protein n=1 Tax=Streptomyces smyrnaeus TaxID=1387713 RepID=UPI0027DD68B4|nr:helix-turn-helix domain-containing protein [Streptomyces smyrnaeus]
MDTHISYLRRKADTSEPKLIRTVRGIGYVIREPRVLLPLPDEAPDVPSTGNAST